ncbi:MAG: acireductone synthase [Alphaproteobacteria bacterium]|nr:acireductone synthase [Alphaproteobacteria bacterium]
MITDIKAIVTDIEGTTSSISFVHDVLFPYARQRLADYIHTHEAETAAILNDVRALENAASLSTDEVIAVLTGWIDEDRKATPLKALQGLIWEEGFKSGAFKGHIYDDAADMLQHWHDQGLKLYIYSSGSIAAQKLLYGYSERGDLTPLLSGYFDTTTGPKREAESYGQIAASLGTPPEQILFLSDITAELDAAQAAGFQTVLLDRENAHPESVPYNKVSDFNDIHIREKAA